MYLLSTFTTLLMFMEAMKVASAGDDLSEFECKGKKYQISVEHQNQMKTCMNKIGISSLKELNNDNIGCFSKCSMIQHGLIDDTGKPHKEKIMNSIEEHVPDEIKGELKPGFENCLDTEGGKIDIKDDHTCPSFVPMMMCVHQIFVKICM